MTSSATELALVTCLVCVGSVQADWPTLHGNARHTGFAAQCPSPPYRLAWVRSFRDERLGTAMEPIVAGDRVFVATHVGNLYALEVSGGQPLWRVQTGAAFLHSPAVQQGLVVAGNAEGTLCGIDGKEGRLRWSICVGSAGFSGSPVVDDGTVFIGERGGDFVAVALESGEVRWRRSCRAPIRQSAAVASGRVFVMSEDLRTHCWEAATGREVWTSEPLTGQTGRDYYPMVVEAGGRAFLIVRTNPILGMGTQIGRDRNVLCQNAGVDDSGWQRVDAWIKSLQARGTPELWSKEQSAIVDYLNEHREARTFHVLDAATGKEAVTAPVLWVAGCQGVGAMPAVTAEGKLLVFYRSAYGNWNHGVAPLVALGLFDVAQNRIAPLEHQAGRQPAWNTFWGTADESQNFVVAGQTVFIVHQGTLSRFDLQSRQLSRVWGERDTYGGLVSPPWARNEWHGPGRGGVAIAGPRIFWLTGSRLLCLVSGGPGPSGQERVIDGFTVPTTQAPRAPAPTRTDLQRQLEGGLTEFLARRWAPLYVEPGLAGRDFSFDQSGDLFEALAWCYPHANRQQQQEVRSFLAAEWARHSPFTKAAWYRLAEGARREHFWTPDEARVRVGQDKPHDPFGNVYAVLLYARRCGEWDRVLQAWPQIQEVFQTFLASGWRLDGAKGDLHANRYLASLLAVATLAEKAGDAHAAQRAQAVADQTGAALLAWWERAASAGTFTNFQGSAQLDPFIGRGDGISFRVAPHRHKVALFRDLTPEVAALIRTEAPEAGRRVWLVFDTLYRTWPFSGEERQVHFGENFVDPPDMALGGFKALAWLREAGFEDLARHVDLPYCRADLNFLTKLALCLEPPASPRKPAAP